ncbi:MAG: NUDIX hydrolase [Maricaulaceae bacterium]
MTNSPPATLIPAATILLLRDGSDGLEVLMLRRNKALKAFGGAWVFPGGRVDDADAPGEDELTRAKAAAVRETAEETGLDIAGAQMSVLSKWIPPIQEKRRFATWFFVAKAPDADVQIDHGEIHDYKWVCPKQVVTDTPDAQTVIMPPTFVSLHDIMDSSTAEAAMAMTDANKTQTFETKFDSTDTGFVTYWEGDAAYETGDLSLAGPRRRLMTGSDSWIYQADI